MRSLTPFIGLSFVTTVVLGLLTAFVSEQVFLFPFSLSLGVLCTLLLLAFILWIYYRAPENTLGVVYRRHFFHRLIKPGESTFCIPLLEQVEMEISLRWRRVDVVKHDVYTSDRYPVEAYVQVIYQVDENLIVTLDRSAWGNIRHFTDRRWDEIVRARAEHVIAWAIHAYPFETVIGASMWPQLGASIRDALQVALRWLGIRVLEVRVQSLHPGRNIEPALQEEKIAAAKVAVQNARIKGLIEALSTGNGHRGRFTSIDLLMTTLAERAMQPEASLPPIMVTTPHGNGTECGDLWKILALLLLLQRMSKQSSKRPSGDGHEPGDGSAIRWSPKAA